MRFLIAGLALAFVSAASAHAEDRALTEQEVEGVQNAIKEMGCTVPDRKIEAEGSRYEADDVICDGSQYDIYLSKDFKVTNKVKED